MTLNNFFNRAATPVGAPRAGAILLARSALPGVCVRRRRLAARTFGLSSLTLFVAALAISGRAHADTLPAPFTSVAAYAAPGMGQSQQGPYSTLASFDAVGPTPFGGTFSASAFAAAIIGPVPSLLVSVSGQGQYQPGDPAAVAILAYFVEVLGPLGSSTSTIVPVDMTSSVQFNGGQDNIFQVTGIVQIGTVFSSLCIASVTDISTCSSDEAANQKISQSIAFHPGVSQEVFMSAAISYLVAPQIVFSGSVDVDPIFTIDPAFLQQNPGYSLELSAGVGNSPATVPEPAAWTMLLAGFGGLGAMRVARRSRGLRRS